MFSFHDYFLEAIEQAFVDRSESYPKSGGSHSDFILHQLTY